MVRCTYTAEKLINDILERVILRLQPEPIIPRKGIPSDKASQDIVRAENAYDTENEECQRDTECEKGLVVDQPAPLAKTTGVDSSEMTYLRSSAKRRILRAAYPARAPMMMESRISYRIMS